MYIYTLKLWCMYLWSDLIVTYNIKGIYKHKLYSVVGYSVVGYGGLIFSCKLSSW